MNLAKQMEIQDFQNLFRIFSIHRVLWHLYAYVTVFKVLMLTLVSLIFLSIHWTHRKLFSHRRVIETNEWDLNSIN
ncbi:hypothetical protein IQ226_08275 [Dolichospermum sp. LEGE 00240]|jgi:hypothetical protein|uniref:hypothetical protein n=1 Tax=Dolichospermum sp. LEGE 00240 TaxID=1828603 RepID=UPI0018804F19|nr:hypothetical protein [Dolichospermum sp. LEGE 00240]MDM3847599.1 hypothetical protein [Aphanizomenon gracile PMC638.10]MDM3851628.1 hypothetical protein [Aphanizomenon gracile PMC627.10]MDM3855718.1 hypothetical protein [Aphanizomenon gracile PMC649.10]MDM3859114.1 hypothetical protein [Aphanizomenon gracile PMC644.10]MBE9249161.1 hypothetical protein [Dolichospermum sp. LEGE 00240]